MTRWQYAVTLAVVAAGAYTFAYTAARSFIEQPAEPLTPAPERTPRVHCITTIRCVEVPEDSGWR